VAKNFLAKVFNALKSEEAQKVSDDSQGVSESQSSAFNGIQSQIHKPSGSKKQLIDEYREMSHFPEIADAIDEIVTEAIVADEDNQYMSLNILDQEISDNDNKVKNLTKEFNHIVNTVLDFNNTAEDLFRKFYIEGELFGEKVIDRDKIKEGIQAIKLLPASTMKVKYDDNSNPEIFIQDLEGTNIQLKHKDRNITDNSIEFDTNQIAYVNSGIINIDAGLTYSYLERAKIPYRQLKWMEDSVLIYRITRAPERRVFYIDVGKLPKTKADAHIKNLIKKYKNRRVYNPTTGEVDVGKDFLHMTEDFYFPVRPDGPGSRVETLPGAANLNEILDLLYFLKKLYKALKVPLSRATGATASLSNIGEEGGGGTTGTLGEITNDEIKFAKYVTSIRKRFGDFIFQIFETHLKLKGIWDQYDLDKEKISIIFNENNEWKELRHLDIIRARTEIFNELSDGYEKTEIFSLNWLYKNIMQFNDTEIADMKEQIKQQKIEGVGEEEEDEFGGEVPTGGEGGEGGEAEEEAVGDVETINTPGVISPTHRGVLVDGHKKK